MGGSEGPGTPWTVYCSFCLLWLVQRTVVTSLLKIVVIPSVWTRYRMNSCHASRVLDSGGLLLRDAEPADHAAPGRGPGRGQARQQGRRGLQTVQHLHGEHLALFLL